MDRRPVGKMGDRSAVRKNRGLAVSLVKQMLNEPIRMGLHLACGSRLERAPREAADDGTWQLSPYGVGRQEESTANYVRQAGRRGDGRVDLGYQWVTRVAGEQVTGCIHGDGIRISPFTLDETLRNLRPRPRRAD